MKNRIIFSAILFLTLCCGRQAVVFGLMREMPPVESQDNILILAPHPDDETIGCAGIIQNALACGAKVHVAYLTNGDHNELAFIVYEKRLTFRRNEFIYMGEVRKREAVKAMSGFGLNKNNLIFMGYPDFGTFAIFSRYWNTQKSYKSLLTRASSVPYKENLTFGAPHNGESILAEFKRVLLKVKPNKIFVTHPADINSDHKALYLFLQVALADLGKLIPPADTYYYLVHSARWPMPRGYHPELAISPPQSCLESSMAWFNLNLTPAQVEAKYKAMLCYKSQTNSSAFYLLSFVRKNELFSVLSDIRLERQTSLKEKGMRFFGFSGLFCEIPDSLGGPDADPADKEGKLSYALVDNSLLIRIEKPEDVNHRFTYLIYLFGYSGSFAFADMPKIRIVGRHKSFKVFDKEKFLSFAPVLVDSTLGLLVVKVPLDLLGGPDFILASVRASGNSLPEDAAGFRKVILK